MHAEHLVNVTELASMDFRAARRRIPLRVPKAGVAYDNHQTLGLLINPADRARAGLTTAFTEAGRLESLLESVIDAHPESALFRSTFD